MLPATRQRRKDARPQELLDAALDLFVEKGFAATRAEEVAVRAGVSKGTLYLYYPSKEELLKAVIRQHLGSEIAAGAEDVARHEGTATQLLGDLIVQWWLAVVESPASGVFKLIITEVRNFPEIAEFYVREVVEPGQRLIGQVLRRGIANGEFREVDVDATVFSLVLPMIMLCLHKHSLAACTATGPDAPGPPTAPLLEPESFIRHHFDLVLRGLLTQPSADHAVAARTASAARTSRAKS
jgi:AcrR family transcriptional regulator